MKILLFVSIFLGFLVFTSAFTYADDDEREEDENRTRVTSAPVTSNENSQPFQQSFTPVRRGEDDDEEEKKSVLGTQQKKDDDDDEDEQGEKRSGTNAGVNKLEKDDDDESQPFFATVHTRQVKRQPVRQVAGEKKSEPVNFINAPVTFLLHSLPQQFYKSNTLTKGMTTTLLSASFLLFLTGLFLLNSGMLPFLKRIRSLISNKPTSLGVEHF